MNTFVYVLLIWGLSGSPDVYVFKDLESCVAEKVWHVAKGRGEVEAECYKRIVE